MPEPILIAAAGASRLLGISRSLFYAMHADGRLGPTAVSFGRRRLWRVSELCEWVQHSPPCPPRQVWAEERRQ